MTLEKSLEHWNDHLPYEFPGTSDGADDWLPPDFSRHSRIENWKNVNFGLHAHIATSGWMLNRPPDQYCIRLENPIKNLVLDGCTREVTEAWVDSFCRRKSGKQGAMLVQVVDDLDLPEKRGLRPLPAMVWLQPLDQCLYAPRDSRHLVTNTSIPVPLPGESAVKLPTPTDQWELDLLLFLGRGRVRNRIHDVVQRRAKLMGGFANVDGERRRKGININDLVDEPAITVLLKHRSIVLRFQEALGEIVRSIGVGCCSPQLPINTIEYVRHVLALGADDEKEAKDKTSTRNPHPDQGRISEESRKGCQREGYGVQQKAGARQTTEERPPTEVTPRTDPASKDAGLLVNRAAEHLREVVEV